MSSVRVSKELKEEIYFLTFTVHRWYYLFDRHNRWNILIDSLKYCRAKRAALITSGKRRICRKSSGLRISI